MTAPALESIVRYVPISEHLATAGQPSEEQLAAVAAAGFELVVNLALQTDPRYSLADEAATVASLGMQYVHIPVQFSAPQLSELAAFSHALQEAGARKVFVHCAHNKRVPVFLALHRVIRSGWAPAQAFAAMREVWQPDATWEAFIAKALAQSAA